MRVLAACKSCSTQYDVSGHTAGETVHCRCGERVVVPEARTHEARLVRCASCGASRGSSDTGCSFCGARFSLSDKGWGTMCPQCYCRLPNDASFCVECGIRIAPLDLKETETKLPCPRCKAVLQQRRFENMEAAECSGCGGLWLPVGAFEEICKSKDNRDAAMGLKGLNPLKAKGRARRVFELTRDEECKYIPCPVCQELMNRRNYGTMSGVIIDTCRDCGVWLDNDELGRIVKFIDANGLERAREREHEERLQAAKAAERRTKRNKGGALMPGEGGGMLFDFGGSPRRSDPLADGIETAARVAFALVSGFFKTRV